MTDIRHVAVRAVDEVVATVIDLLQEAVRDYNTPLIGTPNDLDRTYVYAHENAEAFGAMFDQAAEHVGTTLSTAVEFIAAIKDLLQHEPLLPLPTLSLVRSLFDSTMSLAHLMEGSVGPETRLLRFANLQLTTADETIAAQRAHGGAGNPSLFEANREKLEGWFGKRGIKIRRDKRGRLVETTLGDATQAARWTVTAQAAAYAPRGQILWKVGSGATHNEYWFTAKLEGTDEQIVQMLVGSLLDVADVLADILSAYIGNDANVSHERLHRVRRRLHKAEGEQTYDQYLAQLTRLHDA